MLCGLGIHMHGLLCTLVGAAAVDYGGVSWILQRDKGLRWKAVHCVLICSGAGQRRLTAESSAGCAFLAVVGTGCKAGA